MPNLGNDFYHKLVQICSEVGMNPEDLLATMVSESGINPAAHNPGGAIGLIQFVPTTLKNVGYNGTTEQFGQKSGSEQLDYVKNYIKDKTKFNGGPFKSAAQYYVANFWPVALKLHGVQQENPKAIIVSSRPATDPSGKFSRKYLNLGFKISAKEEAAAYKANSVFDRDKKGYITYGDMMKQVANNKKNPIYLRALAAMKQSTGYVPAIGATMMAKNNPQTTQQPVNDNGILSILTNYLRQIVASEKLNKKLYKQYLPNNDILIKVESDSFNNSVEFSRILCLALDEELMAKANVHTDGSNIEIECLIPGPEQKCFETVKQLNEAIAYAFECATVKIGGIKVKTTAIANKKSSYQEMGFKTATNHYRKFLLKFI